VAESEQVFKEIKRLQGRVDSIDHTLELILGCQDQDKLLAPIMDYFNGSSNRAKVYLEIDGQKCGLEIARATGVSQPAVSQIISKLESLGLIELIDVRENNQKIYMKKKRIDHLLQISSKLLRSR